MLQVTFRVWNRNEQDTIMPEALNDVADIFRKITEVFKYLEQHDGIKIRIDFCD